MNEYVVLTKEAEYHVRASSPDRAKDAIVKLTFGRISRTDVLVRRA
jgi:hypothetical protein